MRGIRHWAGCGDDSYAIVWATLEAPLVQFGTIALPYQPFPSTVALENPEPATLYPRRVTGRRRVRRVMHGSACPAWKNSACLGSKSSERKALRR
jgi:hypothetical protein